MYKLSNLVRKSNDSLLLRTTFFVFCKWRDTKFHFCSSTSSPAFHRNDVLAFEHIFHLFANFRPKAQKKIVNFFIKLKVALFTIYLMSELIECIVWSTFCVIVVYNVGSLSIFFWINALFFMSTPMPPRNWIFHLHVCIFHVCIGAKQNRISEKSIYFFVFECKNPL